MSMWWAKDDPRKKDADCNDDDDDPKSVEWRNHTSDTGRRNRANARPSPKDAVEYRANSKCSAKPKFKRTWPSALQKEISAPDNDKHENGKEAQ